MWLKRFMVLLSILALLVMGAAIAGCGDDDDDDDDDDDAVDDDDDDATGDDETGDDDPSDDDTGDDDDDIVWTGNESVLVSTPDGDVTVELNGLEAFMWTDPEDSTDKPAVLVKTVVDAAFAKDFDPADYKFNFAASDGYNILSKKLDGDYRTLPFYDDLELGWFIEYEEDGGKVTDIQIIWDDTLGYENFMGAKMMNGGTIEMVENILFEDSATVTVAYGTKGKAAVELQGLPAFYDEGNAVYAVYLHHIVLDAALEEFDPKNKVYNFNFISNDADGNWSLADNLDPADPLPLWLDYDFNKDIHNGWIEDAGDDGYRLFWSEDSGFSGMYKVKHMDGGYIDCYDITSVK